MFSKVEWNCRSLEEQKRCPKVSRGEEPDIPKGKAQGEITCWAIIDKCGDLLREA